MINNNMHPAAKFFEENGWVKIEKVIDENIAFILYNHIKFAVTRLSTLGKNLGYDNFHEDVWGTFADKQAPGDFSRYGDLIFDTVMVLITEQMEQYTNKKLIPTYTYHRLYTKGTELKRHKDRPSCEISTTMCLGYDIDNLDKSKRENWNWPMFLGPKTGEKASKGTPVHLNPGDMIIYKGCDVEHWREPFIGNNHAQVFLHYNEKDGKNNILYDGRQFIGLPKKIEYAETRVKETIEKNKQKVY